jgi:hypothetical protein
LWEEGVVDSWTSIEKAVATSTCVTLALLPALRPAQAIDEVRDSSWE